MTTQTELQFRASGSANSQNRRLRDYFMARPGVVIPMPELAKAISATGIGVAVHSRCADLRKLGLDIRHTCDRSEKPYKSFYQYQP